MTYIEQDLYFIIGNELKAERSRANMTLDDVAKKMGVTSMTVQRYEKASRKITVETVRKLCKIYDTDADALMERCVEAFNIRNGKSKSPLAEDELKKTVSWNLTRYMDRTKTSCDDLAEYLHVSSVSVKKWCDGIDAPPIDVMDRICAYFGITRALLLSETPGDWIHEQLSEELLTVSEERLLADFRQLDSVGQDLVCNYTSDLVASGRYSLSTECGSGSGSGEDETA